MGRVSVGSDVDPQVQLDRLRVRPAECQVFAEFLGNYWFRES